MLVRIYAIEKNSVNLIMVARERDGIDRIFRVVNGAYEVVKNEDGTVSPHSKRWKAYYVMQSSLPRYHSLDDAEVVFKEAERILSGNDFVNMGG